VDGNENTNERAWYTIINVRRSSGLLYSSRSENP
jgi:hypothetical protein